jgi:hypothetical protein
MNLRIHGLSVVLTLALAACADSSNGEAVTPDDPSGANDVITSNCPATLDLTVSNISIFSHPETPSDPSLQPEVDAVVTNMRGVSTLHAQGSSLERRSGHCLYDGRMGEGSVYSFDLYSKNGKDILELDYNPRNEIGDVRIYAFPTSYSREGLVFANTGTNSSLFTMVGPAGAEGLPELVKIGKASVR